MNELQIFNSEEFGEIRTVTINGEPWFVGKDVAEALGYERTADAIRQHVEEDYNSVMDIIVRMFNTEHGQVTLDDFELAEIDNPCKVKLTKFSLFVLVNAGFSSKQAVQMMESLLPVCVTIEADNFEGTFEFAEFDAEEDALKGFGNIEQTIGGYVGLLLGEDEKIPVLSI